jgi:hypothetical protein
MGGIERSHDLEEGGESVGTALYRQRPDVKQFEIGGDMGDHPGMRFVGGVRQPHVAVPVRGLGENFSIGFG